MSQPVDKPIGKPMALMEPGRTYYLNGTYLKLVHKERNLSVLIINTLIMWNKHIIQLVSKASQLIGF